MCNEKSNEITAIPELLDTIHTQNAIITIDDMGTQTKIAEKIIEKREYFLETEIEWIDGRERWVGLKAIGGVKSTVTIKEKKTVETRNFITSLNNIDDFARAVRAHWGIENGLHWHLDVTFDEDSSRVRNKNAAGVWNILRKLAMEHIKRIQFGGASLKNLRKLAGWDSSFLERILFTSEK